jgi:hypothetical protein
MLYLIRKKKATVYHLFTGKDTVCTMYSTGGLHSENYQILTDLPNLPLCVQCRANAYGLPEKEANPPSQPKTELYPLVDRLRCKYNGRDFGGKLEVVLPTAIMLEAADVISGLQNLLAVIHRDGGHYTDKHGIQKSIDDALLIVSNLHTTETDALPWKE